MKTSDEVRVGLFASLSPPIFMEMAMQVGKEIPSRTKGHPLLQAYKDNGEPCELFLTETSGVKLFGCECVVLEAEETENILKSDLDILFVSINRYRAIQKEVFND